MANDEHHFDLCVGDRVRIDRDNWLVDGEGDKRAPLGSMTTVICLEAMDGAMVLRHDSGETSGAAGGEGVWEELFKKGSLFLVEKVPRLAEPVDWPAEVLRLAKARWEIGAELRIQPCVYAVKLEGEVYEPHSFPLPMQLGHVGGPYVASKLRQTSIMMPPRMVALAFDAEEMTISQADAKSEGLDPMQWRTWPNETKKRLVKRQNALTVSVSTLECDEVIAVTYTEKDGKIEWGSVTRQTPAPGHNQLENLVARPTRHDTKMKEVARA